MDEIKILTTLEEARAISDPYRFRILKCFYEFNSPATAKQVADKMGEVPAKIHYHVKKLEKAGVLQLIFTKEINGIIAKYYEPTAKSFEVSYNKADSGTLEEALSERAQLVSGLYDTSKKILLDELKLCANSDRKMKATFSMDDLYLTEKEAEELQSYMNKFFKEHDKKSKEEEEVYHCFFTIGQIKK